VASANVLARCDIVVVNFDERQLEHNGYAQHKDLGKHRELHLSFSFVRSRVLFRNLQVLESHIHRTSRDKPAGRQYGDNTRPARAYRSSQASSI
jgi:hypothetical protein